MYDMYLIAVPRHGSAHRRAAVAVLGLQIDVRLGLELSFNRILVGLNYMNDK